MIVLIGNMGAGKSTVGKLLAEKFQLPFYDSDKAICDKFDTEIVKVIEQKGEDGFREIEQEVIAELLAQPFGVLATGGGVIVSPVNIVRLAEHKVIYLSASLEVLQSRIELQASSTNRPLYSREMLSSLYSERHLRYQNLAKLIIDVDVRTPEQIVELGKLQNFVVESAN